MKKVLIAYRLLPEGLKDLEGKYDITLPERSYLRKEEVLEMIGDYEVLVPNFSFYTGQDIIDRGTKLELISNYGVGYNNIDVEYATQKGIAVTNIPNSTREPTAEFAFALLLAAGRRIGYYDRKLRTDDGVSWGIYAEGGLAVFGKTLGIIGMGRIGQALARRAVASGMHIIYHNRNRLDETIEKKYDARYVSLDELLRTADYISLNAPSTPETFHLIGEEELAKMKPSAVFINTARGNMVDEKALARALGKEKIAAAALDVFEDEPNILPELLTLDNVVLAPHAATKTREYRIGMSIEMARNIVGFYEKTFPVSRVNK
ncbi:MAG TPA: dihydrofolate reductase [Porphyromonadaceae bacterium]|uniref:NAD(P)-dependent oxidoreductase n=1 Tax=Limibacterium fermenti TaxID=3229863 RepID=UPI000E9FC7B0|nr:dihydrofolate reductase [Porphyromonadaceae bacterium]HBL35027.1 dihydrofolate reductase [Porphyromonadaceae bacterium]HBX19207.1 dihydrofolate reductase [Porphyromonadaceae bacterium]